MLLEDKNVIITGSGSGVGRAAALRFADEGARVVCADLNLEGAKETVRQIDATGGTAMPIEHTFDDYLKLTAVNFGGVFLGCKHAVIRFKQQGSGGVILNTGSVAGLVGWGGTVYGATKGAVHQLTKAIAVECARHGIRANAICPGAMPYTGFMAAGGMQVATDALDQVAQAAGAGHPLGKPITADDCAEAAVFLCSDRAANITGVLMPVDGGYVAR